MFSGQCPFTVGERFAFARNSTRDRDRGLIDSRCGLNSSNSSTTYAVIVPSENATMRPSSPSRSTFRIDMLLLIGNKLNRGVFMVCSILLTCFVYCSPVHRRTTYDGGHDANLYNEPSRTSCAACTDVPGLDPLRTASHEKGNSPESGASHTSCRHAGDADCWSWRRGETTGNRELLDS